MDLRDHQADKLKPGDTRCGIGYFKPSCMQPFANMVTFIPILCISIIASFAYGIYVLSQVTTLERQFGITSTESGIMLGAIDVGYMVTILLWSHFAKNMHRPRLLALSSFVFAISAVLSVIPHFLMISQASDMYATTETNSTGDFNRRSLCLARNSTLQDPSDLSTGSQRIRRIGFAIMLVAFGVQGIARAPRSPATQTYIDDNVPKTQTGIFMGIIAALIFIGPVCGSILGGVFSRMYVTLEETSLTPRDPRWIGAWWLGFLMFSAIAFVAAIPMTLFPRMMPNAPAKELPRPDLPHKEQVTVAYTLDIKAQEVEKVVSMESPAMKKTTGQRLLLSVIDFFKSFLRLLQNPLYILLVVCDSILFLTVFGKATFYPKYLEQYFRVPMGQSNFLFALTIMLPVGLGISTGGFLTNRLKLTIKGCMILRWVTDGLGTVALFLALIVMCDQPIIYGLSNPSDALKLVSPDVTNMTCDTQCMCNEQDFLPSCGADNKTYFSPCHAGCKNVLPTGVFGNCACVSSPTPFNQTVTPGYCEGQCSSLVFYIVLSIAEVLLSGLNGIPSNLSRLRCVQDRDRSMSIGVNGLLTSLLGFFLGPIIFGRVVDSACILWSNRGFCYMYHGDDLRFKLHVLSGSVSAGVIIVNAIAVLMTYKMKRYCKIADWQRQGFIRAQEVVAAKKKEKKAGVADYEPKHADVTIWPVNDQKDSENTRL